MLMAGMLSAAAEAYALKQLKRFGTVQPYFLSFNILQQKNVQLLSFTSTPTKHLLANFDWNQAVSAIR